jgi:predicted Fe-S protein YdhL (DUF1289 family)
MHSIKYFFDKSSLPLDLQETQKIKKTFDSPCMSVCNFSGEDEARICGTCNMLKDEKINWKASDDPTVKSEIAHQVLSRRNS